MILSKKTVKSPAVLGVLLVIIAVIVVLEATNTTHLFHTKKAVSGPIPANTSHATSTKKSDTTKSTATSSTSSNKADSISAQTTTTPTAGLAPIAPYGSFVSNHHPSLGKDSSMPSSELSSCSTTPNATCAMEFTNSDGVVKTLDAHTADSSGNVSWSWDVNKAGFTKGTWKIKAIASLNGQTKDTADSIDLEVQP